MIKRLRFRFNRLGERLWVRPLVMSVVSLAGVLLARAADQWTDGRFLPQITADSVETLLTVTASSMLVIATFAVGSMVSALASASSTATPRAFSLVVSDDVSQNALSTFIGAFIFSLVALIAMLNGFYGRAGRFALFLLTVLTLTVVILTFVWWVDRIARLGRLGGTVDKVEVVAARALGRRREAPTLGGLVPNGASLSGVPVPASSVGYVQRVDLHALQACAASVGGRVRVVTPAGAFAAPGTILARVIEDPAARVASAPAAPIDPCVFADAFMIGDARTFDEDPRFGLIVLSEIASRALSPAVNDPGTAIDVIGTLVRLFADFCQPLAHDQVRPVAYDRVEMPTLSVHDLFDDAFTGIARDGAGTVEVAGRLQKALAALAGMSEGPVADAARRHARLALARAELALTLEEDKVVIRELAAFAAPAG